MEDLALEVVKNLESEGFCVGLKDENGGIMVIAVKNLKYIKTFLSADMLYRCNSSEASIISGKMLELWNQK